MQKKKVIIGKVLIETSVMAHNKPIKAYWDEKVNLKCVSCQNKTVSGFWIEDKGIPYLYCLGCLGSTTKKEKVESGIQLELFKE